MAGQNRPDTPAIQVRDGPYGFNLVGDGTLALLLPAELSLTQLKFRLSGNLWKKRAFHSETKAFGFIRKMYDQADAYFCTGEFFNARGMGKKRNRAAGYKWADNRYYKVLCCPFDFDAKDGNKKKIFPIVVEMWKRLQDDFGAKHLLLVETGRGYHILWMSFWEDYCEKALEERYGNTKIPIYKRMREPNGKLGYVLDENGKAIIIDWVPYLWYPGNKEHAVEEVKKGIMLKLRDSGFGALKILKSGKRKRTTLFCQDVMVDTRRIVRIPGSFHQERKVVCKWFSSPDEYADYREKLNTLAVNPDRTERPAQIGDSGTPPEAMTKFPNHRRSGEPDQGAVCINIGQDVSVARADGPYNHTQGGVG